MNGASISFGMNGGSEHEFEIKVPGSIANLGPGFDTLAVAVQLYLRLRVRVQGGTSELHFKFARAEPDGENYIERAFQFLAHQRGESFPSLSIEVDSEIPMRAGLGSSAAATVAGLRLYESMAGRLPPQALLNAACALEGHPDNVAAALLGGLTISCQLPDRSVFAVRVEWPESLRFVVLTPEFPLSTSASRSALPEAISLADTVFNLQRLALLLQALQTSNFSLIARSATRPHSPALSGEARSGSPRSSVPRAFGSSRRMSQRRGTVHCRLCSPQPRKH